MPAAPAESDVSIRAVPAELGDRRVRCLLDAPDLLVVAAIVVRRIEAVVVAAVGVDVVLGDEMHLGDEAARRLAC